MGANAGRDFDRWVIVSLRLQGDELAIDGTDETGHRVMAGERSDLCPMPEPQRWPFVTGVRGLAALQRMLDEALAGLTEQREHVLPRGSSMYSLPVPWLLPVFIKPPQGLQALHWEWLLEHLLAPRMSPPLRCVLLRWCRTKSPTAPLPLPWLLVDSRAPANNSAAVLRGHGWYREEDAMHRFGLRIVAEQELDDDVRDAFAQMTIEDAAVAARRGSTTGRLRLEQRRLKVIVRDAAPAVSHTLLMSPWPEAPSVSTLSITRTLSPSGTPDPIDNFVQALVHDFALHEVLWILRQCDPTLQVALASSAGANQSLRLSRTMQGMRDALRSGRLPLPPGSRTSARVEEARHLSMMFDSERQGLTQMARINAKVAAALGSVGLVSPGQAVIEALPPEPRRVEILMERYSDFGVAMAIDRWSRDAPLRCGWRYRLAVQIGQNDDVNSLFEQAPEAIDALLPTLPQDSIAHELEACIYGKRFELLSEPVQALLLPRRGPSNAVFFELRAPLESGPADLRVVIYHQNNLLQSFVVEAQVAQDVATGGKAPQHKLRARLASSGVTDFGAFEPARRRALSVALNQDLGSEQHTLMVKADRARFETHPEKNALDNISARFHKVLSGIDAGVGFKITVSRLAQIGRELWLLLEKNSARSDTTLARLRQGEARETVQFVRHGDEFSLPWQTLYDLQLPSGEAFRNPRICMADTPVRQQDPPDGPGCRHHPGEPVICIEGFWSLRHRVELISEDRAVASSTEGAGAQAAVPRTRRVVALQPHPAVALGRSIASPKVDALETSLRSNFGPRLHVFSKQDAPVDRSLWQPERRPALLVLLSHMHEADLEANEPQRLYAVAPEDEASAISSEGMLEAKSRLDAWSGDERPLVLLMACQSAERRALALNKFTDSLLAVGASAVVGTECDLLASEAARFAEHVAKATLKDKLNLGEAMRRFHLQELKGGECTAFVFTAYGDADLTLDAGAMT